MASLFGAQMLSQPSSAFNVESPIQDDSLSQFAGLGLNLGVNLARGSAVAEAEREATAQGEALVADLQSAGGMPTPRGSMAVSEAYRQAERLAQASRISGKTMQFQTMAQAKMKELINSNPLFTKEIRETFGTVLGKDSVYNTILEHEIEMK